MEPEGSGKELGQRAQVEWLEEDISMLLVVSLYLVVALGVGKGGLEFCKKII